MLLNKAALAKNDTFGVLKTTTFNIVGEHMKNLTCNHSPRLSIAMKSNANLT